MFKTKQMTTYNHNQLPIIEPKSQNKINYKFSPQSKSTRITLSNENSRANNLNQIQSDDLALIQGFVSPKGSSIRFKIPSIDWLVAVGLGIKSIIEDNEYKFLNGSQTGHGCFLMFNSDRMFCHSSEKFNFVDTHFMFKAGDVIRVQTQGKWLLFLNETNKKDFKMRIHMADDQWEDARFCVYLHCKGDSVQIL